MGGWEVKRAAGRGKAMWNAGSGTGCKVWRDFW